MVRGEVVAARRGAWRWSRVMAVVSYIHRGVAGPMHACVRIQWGFLSLDRREARHSRNSSRAQSSTNQPAGQRVATWQPDTSSVW